LDQSLVTKKIFNPVLFMWLL